MSRFYDRVALTLAFAAVLGSVAIVLCAGAKVSDPDYFNYIGRCLFAGRRLYTDIWDCKGPVLYFIASIGTFIHPVVGLNLLFAAFFLADLVLFHGLVRQIGGCRPGLCTLLFAVLVLAVGNFTILGRQEMLVCLLVLAGLRIQGRFAPWGDLLTGMGAGLVFFIKPNLISFLSVPLVQGLQTAVRTETWGRFALRCLCLALGFAFVLLVVTACFFPDAVEDLWYGSLLWNLLERSQNRPSWLGFWQEALASWEYWRSFAWIIPIFWPLLVLGCVRVIASRNWAWSCWVAWALLETAAAFAAPWFYAYYVIVACLPVALLVASAPHQVAAERKDGRFVALVAIVVLLCVGLKVRPLWRHIKAAPLRTSEISMMAESMGTSPGGVTVFGGNRTAAVMTKLGRLSPQRFAGISYWWKLSSGDFRDALAEDFLSSLASDGEWLLSELPIEILSCELGDARIAAKLSEYRLCYRARKNRVFLYRRFR